MRIVCRRPQCRHDHLAAPDQRPPGSMQNRGGPSTLQRWFARVASGLQRFPSSLPLHGFASRPTRRSPVAPWNMAQKACFPSLPAASCRCRGCTSTCASALGAGRCGGRPRRLPCSRCAPIGCVAHGCQYILFSLCNSSRLGRRPIFPRDLPMALGALEILIHSCCRVSLLPVAFGAMEGHSCGQMCQIASISAFALPRQVRRRSPTFFARGQRFGAGSL